MARIYLVRHGEPTGSWGTSPDPDPGLSDLGHQQAAAAADRLRLLTPRQVVTSPLKRASETAVPLAKALDMQMLVEKSVAEIPTPSGVPIHGRGDWLRDVMARSWSDVDQGLRPWRQSALDYLMGLSTDTAVFSHYVLINVAVGAAIGDERVHCFAPAHASVTILDTNGRGLTLIELGATGTSAIR